MTANIVEQKEDLPAKRGGAKALLLTVLGEFVLPAGGSVWTSSLVTAAGELDIHEKNARQAIARIGEEGLIQSARHGRSVRWSLTAAGQQLLESGAARIYQFGSVDIPWGGEWLVVHCPISESRRSDRNRLRTQLAFLGFGELSANLFTSPHIERESALRLVLRELGLLEECFVFRSEIGSEAERTRLVGQAWDLEQLAKAYSGFDLTYQDRVVIDGGGAFRSTVELVHDWRRFPFTDPELPAELLPSPWAGHVSAKLFRGLRDRWSDDAQGWFSRLEA